MKKLNLLLFCFALFYACDDRQTEIEKKEDNSLIEYKVVDSFKLNNDALLKAIRQKADMNNCMFVSLNEYSTKSTEEIVTWDFEDATIYEYDNSDVKAILVEGCGSSANKYTLASLINSDNKISEESIFISQEFISNQEVITGIYNDNYDLLFKIHIKDEEILSLTTFNDIENLSNTKGWFGRWGKCIGRAMDRMSSGTVAGSVEAMFCVAFGPSCAIGTSIGCAGRATFYNY
ncbi:hypothetical protein [Marinifilum caeruleilacunae]|uniref:Lipoprotein n=1 Tax=Marinifilum caeruleilacunae TaxID=2499076 RepID=A0ABX1X023_9BACT|nr:hypothetical protein [Marinifilum caeruleilacunae]NOU61702.1 hypothetical protein [Marinifilum caeruleilacunae]